MFFQAGQLKSRLAYLWDFHVISAIIVPLFLERFSSCYLKQFLDRCKTFCALSCWHFTEPITENKLVLCYQLILGDPGADSGGEGKSKRAGKYGARKVKNGEKSPLGQCLTRPVLNCRRRSAFWLGRKTQKLSGTNQKPERQRQFGTGLVRHCPQGFFSPSFTFRRAIFSRPFRLSLAPTICPWVSEDANNPIERFHRTSRRSDWCSK